MVPLGNLIIMKVQSGNGKSFLSLPLPSSATLHHSQSVKVLLLSVAKPVLHEDKKTSPLEVRE